MRIAFDLDDTLIPSRQDVPIEHGMWHTLVKLFFRERLRQGTCGLLRQLHREGYDVWIYTTSLRPPSRIKLWFWCLGIHLGGVINYTTHIKMITPRSGPECCASKYPPTFNIQWLVDDSLGVKEEGRRYGFAVIHVLPDDRQWIATIRQALVSAGKPFPFPSLDQE